MDNPGSTLPTGINPPAVNFPSGCLTVFNTADISAIDCGILPIFSPPFYFFNHILSIANLAPCDTTDIFWNATSQLLVLSPQSGEGFIKAGSLKTSTA